MKKYLVVALMMVCGVYAMAQGNPIEVSEVVQEEGKSVSELYPIIKAWVATNFRSANDVIQMDDPDNGIMIVKGNYSYRAPGGATYRYIDGYVNFTMKIQVREGRYKVDFSDFTHHSDDPQYRNTWSFGLITDREKYKEKGLQDKRWTKTWPDLQSNSRIKGESLIASLKAATSGAVPVLDNQDDW